MYIMPCPWNHYQPSIWEQAHQSMDALHGHNAVILSPNHRCWGARIPQAIRQTLLRGRQPAHHAPQSREETSSLAVAPHALIYPLVEEIAVGLG